MRHYTITRISGQPDWNTIPCLNVDNYQWLLPLDISMHAQLCYNDYGIYVHFRAWEKNIRAVYDAPLSPVCEDSCMEFFLRPVAEDLRYFNIEMNPNGTAYLGFGGERDSRIRLIVKNEDQLLDKQVHRLDDGWELFFTVPLSFLQTFYPGYQLDSGNVLYANCYKCGDRTEKPHYISWNPIDSETPNFHVPQCFGQMVLE